MGDSYYVTGQYGPPGRVSSNTYVRECLTCGAAVYQDSEKLAKHDKFHAEFSNRKGSEMGAVLWCDPGDHPFKADAKGSFRGSAQIIGDDNQPHSETMDACATHNPMRAQPQYIVKELEEKYPTSGAPVNAVSTYPQDEIPGTW